MSYSFKSLSQFLCACMLALLLSSCTQIAGLFTGSNMPHFLQYAVQEISLASLVPEGANSVDYNLIVSPTGEAFTVFVVHNEDPLVDDQIVIYNETDDIVLSRSEGEAFEFNEYSYFTDDGAIANGNLLFYPDKDPPELTQQTALPGRGAGVIEPGANFSYLFSRAATAGSVELQTFDDNGLPQTTADLAFGGSGTLHLTALHDYLDTDDTRDVVLLGEGADAQGGSERVAIVIPSAEPFAPTTPLIDNYTSVTMATDAERLWYTDAGVLAVTSREQDLLVERYSLDDGSLQGEMQVVTGPAWYRRRFQVMPLARDDRYLVFDLALRSLFVVEGPW